MWSCSLDYLICPECNNPNMTFLGSSSEINNTPTKISLNDTPAIINEGQISCPACSRTFPILDGIPILLGDNRSDVDAESLFEPSDEHLDYPLESTKKVARLLSEYKVGTALDVACGLGAYTSFFKCDTLVSFDLSPYFLKKCLEREGREEGRHWLVADVLKMPFKEDTFDLIFASSILEHLEFQEAKQVFQRFNSLLKEGGLIQIDVPNSSRLQELLRKLMIHIKIYRKKEFEEHAELGHHCLFVQKDLEKLGFEVHGCIGWVTRQKLPIGILWELYDFIGWYRPSLSGTLIGLRKATET